jgi:hypothetical protein
MQVMSQRGADLRAHPVVRLAEHVAALAVSDQHAVGADLAQHARR